MQLFVDNLTVIDCTYLHPIHGLEGESWICDLLLDGGLDACSMVMDFGRVKKSVKQAIDASVDHCLLVPMRAPNLRSFEEQNGQVALHWRNAAGEDFKLACPAVAICRIDAEQILPEAVAAHLQTHLMGVVDATVKQLSIGLRHECIDGPYYHYTHGLKKHDGHCQRIAHGHRSKLEIWRNGAAAVDAVAEYCADWNHGYIASTEDITGESERDGVVYLQMGYRAGEGAFSLEMPASRCRIIDADSTVECIANHIAATLKQRELDADWRVKAYEGVQKGAIASA